MYNFREIFAYDNWKALPNDQKYEALQNLENYYAYVQNRPSHRVVPDSKTSNFGYFNEGNNCIYINSNLVENGCLFDGGSIREDANLQCFDTIVHEGRHAYQKYVREHPELCDDHKYVEDMLLNEGHYFGSSEGLCYLVQPQEKDAWGYATNETMKTFQGQMENEPGYHQYLQTVHSSSPERAEEMMLQENPNAIEEMNQIMEEGCLAQNINYHPYSNESTMFEENNSKPKTLHRNPDELRDAGLRNIDDLVDTYKDDLLEKGYEEGPELDGLLEQKRMEEIDQFNKDAFGEDTSNYIKYDQLNDDSKNISMLNAEEGNTFTGISDSEVSNPKTLHRDPDELRDAGLRNIDDLVDTYKDDLLEKGYEEGPELDGLLEQKRMEEIDQFNKDAFGEDTSNYIGYDQPNDSFEDESLFNSDEKENLTENIPQNLDDTESMLDSNDDKIEESFKNDNGIDSENTDFQGLNDETSLFNQNDMDNQNMSSENEEQNLGVNADLSDSNDDKTEESFKNDNRINSENTDFQGLNDETSLFNQNDMDNQNMSGENEEQNLEENANLFDSNEDAVDNSINQQDSNMMNGEGVSSDTEQWNQSDSNLNNDNANNQNDYSNAGENQENSY